MSTILDLPTSAEPVHPVDSIRGVIWTGEQSAQIAWWVPYDDVDAFADAVYGTYQTISYGAGAMTRRVPLIHPRYPNLYATALQVAYDGFREDPPNVFDRYSIAKVTVDFAIPPYNPGGPVPFAAFQRRVAVGVLSIPSIQMRYVTSGRPIQYDATIPMTTYDLNVTLFGMSVPNPTGLMVAEENPLNSEPFNTPWGTYGVGTVLYTSMNDSTQVFTGSFQTYQCTLHFRVRPYLRWDFRPLENGSGFDRVEFANGDPSIPMSDLNSIFAF